MGLSIWQPCAWGGAVARLRPWFLSGRTRNSFSRANQHDCLALSCQRGLCPNQQTCRWERFWSWDSRSTSGICLWGWLLIHSRSFLMLMDRMIKLWSNELLPGYPEFTLGKGYDQLPWKFLRSLVGLTMSQCHWQFQSFVGEVPSINDNVPKYVIHSSIHSCTHASVTLLK